MNDYINMWEPIVSSFVDLYNASYEERGYEVPDHLVDWYPSGYLEITAKMDSGDRYIFEFMNSRIIPLRSNKDHENMRREINDSEDAWRSNFSKRLQTRMRRQGITREKLSELSGISNATLSKYMNGHSSPSGYNLERICYALNCSINELVSVY